MFGCFPNESKCEWRSIKPFADRFNEVHVLVDLDCPPSIDEVWVATKEWINSYDYEVGWFRALWRTQVEEAT